VEHEGDHDVVVAVADVGMEGVAVDEGGRGGSAAGGGEHVGEFVDGDDGGAGRHQLGGDLSGPAAELQGAGAGFDAERVDEPPAQPAAPARGQEDRGVRRVVPGSEPHEE
jgi:hypothetical protein